MSENELEKEEEKVKLIRMERKEVVEKEISFDSAVMEALKKEVRDISILRLLEREFINKIKKELNEFSSVEYPKWVYKPWARIKPHENFVESWYNKWSDVLVAYCKKTKRFRLSIQELINVFPFTDGERSLSFDDLRNIVEILSKKGIAKWLDSNKMDFLIYWIPKQQLIEKIYDEAKELGLPILRTKIIKEALNDLPNDELIEIMMELVNNNYGRWIVFKEALKINYPL